MRWSRQRSEMVLHLRCILLNGQWTEFTHYLIRQSRDKPASTADTDCLAHGQEGGLSRYRGRACKSVILQEDRDLHPIHFELEGPLYLPAGSKITGIGVYDNSLGNRWNPGPQLEVYWGQQSWDEMYQAFTEYTVESQDLTKPQPSHERGIVRPECQPRPERAIQLSSRSSRFGSTVTGVWRWAPEGVVSCGDRSVRVVSLGLVMTAVGLLAPAAAPAQPQQQRPEGQIPGPWTARPRAATRSRSSTAPRISQAPGSSSRQGCGSNGVQVPCRQLADSGG